MKKALICALLTCSYAGASIAQDKISSSAIGVYDSNERMLVVPAFIDSVNSYLRRYEPRLVEKDTDRAKMQAKYDYLYDIEIRIMDDTYEISATLAEEVRREGKAQKLAAHLATGVHRSMEKYVVRGTRVRDRTDRDGIR